jgi:riboflavin kinase/FMN adenylyltransferase
MHYPTANLDAGEQLAPAEGVYAGLAEVADDLVPAAISVGPRPTFDDPTTAVEAFLLDSPGQLYGSTLSLQFVSYLRGLERFDSPEALRAQMDKDVQRVKELLV